MASDVEWLTSAEAAEMLRVTQSSISRYISRGHIKAVQLPGRRGHLRIPRSEIDRLLQIDLPEEPLAQNDPAGGSRASTGSFCGGEDLQAAVTATA